jgi:hypothetical protein
VPGDDVRLAKQRAVACEMVVREMRNFPALRTGLVDRARPVCGWLQPARLALRARSRAHGRGRRARAPAREAAPAPGLGRATAVPPRGRALAARGPVWPWSCSTRCRPGSAYAACGAASGGSYQGRLLRRHRLPSDLLVGGQPAAAAGRLLSARAVRARRAAAAPPRWRSSSWPRSTAPAASTGASAGRVCASPAGSSGPPSCPPRATCA